MTRVQKLAKQIEEATARQEAILAAAEGDGDGRDLTADEQAEFDALQAKKAKLKTDLARAEQLERDKAEAARPAFAPAAGEQPFNPHAATAGGTASVPARGRRHGPLKAFRGQGAADRAYEAGLWAAAALYDHAPSRDAYASQFGAIQATLSTVNNSGAAYFVPDVIDTAVLELTEQYGVFRRFADVVPMASDTLLSPRWTGGMVAYWVAEGTAPAASDPSWDMIQLVAKNLAAMTKMTRQLDEDMIVDLGDKVAMAAAIAFSYAEDNAGWNGDGTSQYGGITGLLPKLAHADSAASVSTAASGHTTPATLTLADYYAVLGKYPNWQGASPRWFAHKEVYAASMMPLQLAAGGTNPADIQNGARPMFLGHPVEFVNVGTRVAAATAGTIPIVFGDLALSSKLGDRRRSRTMERGFVNDDFTRQLFTLFAASRVDIVNHTVTDPKNSSNAGPVVGLKLAAS